MTLRARRTRFNLPIAVAGIVALTLVGAAPPGGIGASEAFGQAPPAYLRINISDEATVYLHVQTTELRAAMSAEGLASAVPVKGPVKGPILEIPLPIPAHQLPKEITAVKACLTVYELRRRPSGSDGGPYITGQLVINRTDNWKAVWQYRVYVGTRGGDSADNAPEIQFPDIDNLTVSVTGRMINGELQVVAMAMAQKAEVNVIRKNGKSVNAVVTVSDATGRQVDWREAPLTSFGFTNGRGVHSVRVAPGVYTCAATVDPGPWGPSLKGETQFTVP